MSNDKMVWLGDVIEALQELKAHEVPDMADAEAVGEAIKEHGHTLYDMGVDIDDVADWDQIAEEIDLRKVVGNHSCSELVKEACEWHGSIEVMEELKDWNSNSDWVRAVSREYDALPQSEKDAFLEERGYCLKANAQSYASAKEGIDALTERFGHYKVLGEFSLLMIKNYLKDMHGLGMDDIPEPTPATKVIDGLEWMVHPQPDMEWWAAKEYALKYSGEGWRLPTVAELVALWDYDAGNCPHFDASGVYWSRAQVKQESNRAWGVWGVCFTTGSTLNLHTDDKFYVRLVRKVAG